MEYKVIVPPLGESVVEGTIVKWLKNEGDAIKIDDPLVEIMTDKINVEVPSPYDGVMKKHLVPVDTTVEIGTAIAIMEVGAGAVEAKTFQTKPDGKEHIPQEQEAPEPAEEFVAARSHHEKMGIHADNESIEAGIQAVHSSPVVRRLAREHFIDLRKVQGTGREGRISKEDVIKYIDSRHRVDIIKPDFVFPDQEPEEVIPITGVRKVIAQHMVDSAFTIPHVTTFDESDMSEIIAWRKRHVEKIEKTHGVKITFMPFIAKAIVFAAKDFPWINSTLENETLHVKK